ncbi:MAG: tetratricopeptide repeat protein, partial [Chroococcales cyanobacterium]
ETLRRSLDVAIILNVAGKGLPLRQFFGEKIRLILWTQQLPTLNAMQPLENPAERDVYDGFAFVSEWQRHQFELVFNINSERSAILRNAIAPAFQNLFPPNTSILSHKSHPPILAYTSTPFRGLDLLLSIFPKIRQAIPGTILKVFSSKKVYQLREDIDESVYGSLYQRCRDMEGVEYLGSVSQPELAQQLRSVSLLTYPNTFKETSCIAVMEAMASGCRVVTSNLAALTETAAGFCPLVSVEDVQGFSSVRDWQFSLRTDWQNYASRFVETTVQAIADLQAFNAESQLQQQLNYIQTSCTWEVRATTWIDWLSELCGLDSLSPPPEIPPISTAQTLTEQAQNAYHQGEFKQAIHLCQQAIKLNPQATQPYQVLGESFQKLDQCIEASRAYATALNLLELSEIDPIESLQLREKLGRILYEIGDIEAAIACWQAWISIKPDSAAAYHNLGLLLELDNQLNKAIDFYQRAIALQPDSGEIYFKLVNALMQSGQLLEAIATCRKALTLNPNLATTYFPGASVAASGHLSPQVWKDSQQLSFFNSTINYTQIYPENQVQLAPPQTLSPPLHPTFHIKIGPSSAAFVVELMNGRAWGDRANSIVLTQDQALVADVSTGDAIVALFACLNQYPPVTQFPGTVAFLSQQAGGDYYHWMVDVLPRLELLRQQGWSWDEIDIFVVNGLQHSFQETSLKALGIPLDKIVTSQQYPHIQAHRLLVPSLPTHPPKWAGNFIDGVPHWVCQFLRETFLPKF